MADETAAELRPKSKVKFGAWVREHWLEAVGVLVAIAALIFLYLRNKGQSSVVAPAASGTPPSSGSTDTGGGVSQADLTTLQQQMTAAIQQSQATLSGAEQADVASLVAQIQQDGANLTTVQQQLTAAQQQANASQQAALQQMQQQVTNQTNAQFAALEGKGFSGDLAGLQLGLSQAQGNANAALAAQQQQQKGK